MPLQAVRVHTDARARSAVGALGARAFTYGTDVFVGAKESPRDLALMSHEVAHVIQQQGEPVLQTAGRGGSDRFEREAEHASTAVQRGQSVSIVQQTNGPRIQGLGLSDILDGLANLAANVPGFTLLTVIIGRNPINLRVVERNFTNLLRGFIGLIPGGELLFQILQRYGVVTRIGTWVEQQVSAFGLSYDYFRGRFTAFTDSLGWRDIFSPSDVWRRARDIFTEPIARIHNFISILITQAIAWLKETFMEPLSGFCREIPGYGLVTVLLGRDPFTNTPVPRTAINVVRAFAEFIPGGTEKVNQLVESHALERAYTWFTQETQTRNLTWDRVTGTFTAAWNSFQLEDVLHPIDTLRRVVGLFRPLLTDLVSFAGAALMKLLELIFEAVMGSGGARILAIIKRARATFNTIIQNPVGFLRNLLSAIGQGVRQFMGNILRHLRDGVIAWLTGPVAAAGIQMPERWDLPGIIGFVLQILGLTWARVRQKLVNLLGERVVAGLESAFRLIQDIRRLGLVAALRERVTEFFGQLREAALGSIRNFIQQRLVMAGITQLISMLNPVGAVIQAIIKTYTTIQFFIQKINQILDVVESIVDSIAAIAAGAIGAAANFVERTMARTIPVVLDFLARFIGLGDVGSQVQTTIRNLQGSVDRMLDRAVEWIRTMAQRAVASGSAAITRATAAVRGWWNARKPFRASDGSSHTLLFQGDGPTARLAFETTPTVLVDYLNTLPATTAAQTVIKQRILGNVARIQTLKATPGNDVAIDAAMTAIGQDLGSLVNSGRWGSEDQPLPLNYPKPRASAYRLLFLGPETSRIIPQTELEAAFSEPLLSAGGPGIRRRTIINRLRVAEANEWETTHYRILRYRPTQQQALPGKSRQIGLTPNYAIEVGKKLRLNPGNTAGGRKINSALGAYGYDSGTEHTDGDHVVEMQLGGPNELENLWPLNSAINQAGGSNTANAQLVKPDSSRISMRDLKDTARTRPVWLLIAGTL